MLTRFKIYRDPNSDAGGAASAASSNGAASASTPAGGGQAPASPGDNPMMNFAAGLAKAVQKTPSASLPAGDGKQTPAAATAGEGDAGGDDEPKDQGTTADSDLEAGDEEEQEGAEPEKEWSKEERKTLEAMKADLPFSAASRAVLKSLRDTRAQYDKVSASNTNAISRTQALEAALYSGDAKALQEMGFDLKLDQRTPDDMVKELEAEFNATKDVMLPVIEKLAETDPNAAAMVKKAVQKVLGRYNDRAATIEKERERSSFKEEVLREAGVKRDTGNGYKDLSQKAQNNLAALSQEDPKAGEYFKFIEAETKPGGGLHALGLNLARAYGTSLEAARTMNRIAKGMFYEKNMKSILADKRKAWEKDRVKRAQTERVGGDSRAPAAATANGIHQHVAAGMRAYMGRG